MRKFLNKRNVIVLIVLVLVGGWWYKSLKNKKAEKDKIRIVNVERKDIVSRLTVSGKIEAERKVVLNFSSSGKLGYVKVSEGGVVKKGQYLMGLDMGDLDAAERAAYFNYLAADANAKEIEDGVKGHDSDETFVQKNDRVTAQTSRDKAYDVWLLAQRAKRNANLISPIAGVIVNLTSNVVGDTVGIGDGVTIIDPESLYFETEVDESDLNQVKIGQEVEVVLDAFANKKITGQVDKIGFEARVSSTGATVFPMWITVGSEGLRLGMNGDAQILLEKRAGVLVLPFEAVVDGQVETIDGRKLKVEVGLESETEIEIIGGLNEGDRVVIK